MKKAKEPVRLTQRQQVVLSALIHHFISNAQPVSSKTVKEISRIQVSTATIRNTMSQLERMGMIEHPHTSAGKQPTELGYRMYLDSLIQLQELETLEKSIILRGLKNIRQEDQAFKAASNILSKLSSLIALAAAPYLKSGKFQDIRLIPVAEKKVMLILTITDGLVRSVVMEMKVDIKPSQLEKIMDELNERLRGKPVSFLNTTAITSLAKTAKPAFSGPVRLFTCSILKLIQSLDYDNIQIAGAKNIYKHPEFAKIEDIEGIIELLDDRETLVHFLQKRGVEKGLQITVGKENKSGLFSTHTVITSTFSLGGIRSTIGVIGPMRMDYSKMISVVDFTSKILNRNFGADLPGE